MRDIRTAIDRTKEEFGFTLERCIDIILNSDNLTSELKEELEVQTALAIDKYKEFSLLDKKVLNNFANYCILPIFLNPSGNSRVDAHKPFERNFIIDYTVTICKPKNKHKFQILSPDLIKKSISLDDKKFSEFTDVPDLQYTLDRVLEAEIKRPRKIIFEDDGIVFLNNKRSWKKIKIDKSYVDIKPNYTNKFKATKIYSSNHYLQSLSYRLKSPMSLVHKYYDFLFKLDKIHPEHFKDYNLEDASSFTKKDWELLLENFESDTEISLKKEDALPDYKGEVRKNNKLKSMFDVISDIKAMRIITPERTYASKIPGYLAEKLFGQNIEEYYTNNPNFNRDRLNDDNIIQDGFIQYRPYCKERGTKKNNGYETYQGDLRYGGGLIELQVRSLPMHLFNEYGGADHEKYVGLKAIRRACHMNTDSRYKEIYKLFRRVFYNVEFKF